jgi:hypothetical protein
LFVVPFFGACLWAIVASGRLAVVVLAIVLIGGAMLGAFLLMAHHIDKWAAAILADYQRSVRLGRTTG